MAGSANFDDDGINEINIVPLVDIVLVLLIIFMVTAQFLKQKPEEKPPGIEVELPAASTGSALNDSLVSIVINKSGELFLNGKPTTDDAIKAFVKNASKPAKELETLVAADKGIAHGEVVRVIDFLRELGVERFAINTKPQEIE